IELASAFGREILLREAIDTWEAAGKEAAGETPADYVILDCPPSLGLLSINGLAAAHEVIVTLQTEFFALQGISKLVEIVQLMRRRINPNLNVAGILPTLYDTRLKLAREVLAEIRRYFPGQVFSRPIRTNIKLAEAPSHGVSIFEYAPNSPGARDYLILAREIMAAESQDPELAQRDLHVPAVDQLEATLAEMARPPKARPRPQAPEPTPASDSEDPELPMVELTPASAPATAPEPQAEADADPEWSPADPKPSPAALPQGSESYGGPGAEPEATGPLATTCDEFAPHLGADIAPAPELEEGREWVGDPQVEVEATAAPLEPKSNYNFAPNNGAERAHMPSRSRLGPLARRSLSGPTGD
ncbi:MAG: AAA family ATPase, partial [Planctomycetota bacterium]|nr:AAA family ATPase [Planctomycetota bacterium]